MYIMKVQMRLDELFFDLVFSQNFGFVLSILFYFPHRGGFWLRFAICVLAVWNGLVYSVQVHLLYLDELCMNNAYNSFT